jgi:uncharacterized protein involved in type VI secretion and phage assembly
MSGVLYDVNGDPLYLGTYHGIVTDNADPQKIGRVRVQVPGLIEPASEWALPRGSGSSGAKALGGYDVPPKGASVIVSFLSGHIDVPIYEGAWHGLTEQHSVVPADPKDADKVKVFESARFLIVLNGAGGAEELLIKDKNTGDLISMKPSQLKIQATTKVTVVAPNVELGSDGLATAPLINGVVLGSGIDTFTGATYGVLGSASATVTAKKV